MFESIPTHPAGSGARGVFLLGLDTCEANVFEGWMLFK